MNECFARCVSPPWLHLSLLLSLSGAREGVGSNLQQPLNLGSMTLYCWTRGPFRDCSYHLQVERHNANACSNGRLGCQDFRHDLAACESSLRAFNAYRDQRTLSVPHDHTLFSGAGDDAARASTALARIFFVGDASHPFVILRRLELPLHFGFCCALLCSAVLCCACSVVLFLLFFISARVDVLSSDPSRSALTGVSSNRP